METELQTINKTRERLIAEAMVLVEGFMDNFVKKAEQSMNHPNARWILKAGSFRIDLWSGPDYNEDCEWGEPLDRIKYDFVAEAPGGDWVLERAIDYQWGNQSNIEFDPIAPK